jgi:hypothetical protein
MTEQEHDETQKSTEPVPENFDSAKTESHQADSEAP